MSTVIKKNADEIGGRSLLVPLLLSRSRPHSRGRFAAPACKKMMASVLMAYAMEKRIGRLCNDADSDCLGNPQKLVD